MQELLGFFLVANDETRRNVNSLIKVATFKYTFKETKKFKIRTIFEQTLRYSFKFSHHVSITIRKQSVVQSS